MTSTLAPSIPAECKTGAPVAPVGLYVHVPFCDAICTYCNFTRGLYEADLVRRYVDAVVCEIGRDDVPDGADTLYLGGGTPSVLEADDVCRIVEACRASCGLTDDAEVTMEANPESASAARLAGYRAVGVNRLSLGVQSFQDGDLRRLGRLHDAAGARRACDRARDAGFDDVSLDLMMWLPGQSVAAWLESVDALVVLQPDHASLYLLEVYPNAPLREEMLRRSWTQAPDDQAAEMYHAALDRLAAAGYRQYEISNVARRGHRSRHNLKYWTDGRWWGFGPGAHSTMGPDRWQNMSETAAYVERLETGGDPMLDRQRLAPDDRASEALFMGLRLVDGVDVNAVGERYGVDVRGRYGAALQPFIEGGQLIDAGACLRLSRAGMLLANEIMAVFV